MSDGADFLDEQAKVRPSIHKADDLWTELETLWEKGLPSGSRTGWPSLDQFYTVAPGQWTLVTGFPGSGEERIRRRASGQPDEDRVALRHLQPGKPTARASRVEDGREVVG